MKFQITRGKARVAVTDISGFVSTPPVSCQRDNVGVKAWAGCQKQIRAKTNWAIKTCRWKHYVNLEFSHVPWGINGFSEFKAEADFYQVVSKQDLFLILAIGSPFSGFVQSLKRKTQQKRGFNPLSGRLSQSETPESLRVQCNRSLMKSERKKHPHVLQTIN